MRGVTHGRVERHRRVQISTRTPHAGSDIRVTGAQLLVFISTRTPHAGSDRRQALHGEAQDISTRTPHAGSDVRAVVQRRRGVLISTRTPHAGSDGRGERCGAFEGRFQPALPMRGLTRRARIPGQPRHISTRTPHAGSDRGRDSFPALLSISTRTPHAGSDRGRGHTPP